MRSLGRCSAPEVRAVAGAFSACGVQLHEQHGAPLFQMLLTAEALRDPALAAEAVRAARATGWSLEAPHVAAMHRCLVRAGDLRGALAWALSEAVESSTGIGSAEQRLMLADVELAAAAVQAGGGCDSVAAEAITAAAARAVARLA
ncbi:hypothetical protein FNF27_02847 [Cafeteria roenbergensis]|uniref:Uncharacterized protein n=2 Tax=Cafeteria roenbergensis TaxID=33653 RepID=A0A5A8D7G5_CAFRO|nr:hypothetical protein FNF29_03222 [Cafeteria roenbergensis]KAA0161118.1 hypothetical protein FNF31_03959 [Cafeteria roenbergensis]KAA0170867.1 hypothetical protein FNF28_01140 [Cafeteria roenbergensis]KAA0175761.1 hypothetical protein FNF27_02847 [Cafeteria roenbergensis]|eukprot:KAA0153405.1 hypothetical protein FNF29_03222 [Cafeteria roenbergensis]